MALTQVSTGGIKDAQVLTADLADGQVTVGKLHADALDRTYTLGASGTDHYTFTGEGLTGAVNDPTLYLTRGKTYRFVNGNSSGQHPFRIQSTTGTSGTEYNTGVTNNAGAGGSTIIFEVPHDAPDALYYQCTAHTNMNGILYVTGALADESVTLAKLEHGTSSNNGKFLRANNGADPTFESLPANQTLTYPNGGTAVTTSTNNEIQVNSSNSKVVFDTDTGNTHHISFAGPSTLTKTSTFTLPEDGSNGQYLKTNGSGVLSFATIAQPDLTNLSASNLTSGTIPDARFPATLPAVSGANLTNISAGGASNISFNSGNGIDFSATADGTGSSNTSELFHDYEEGEWTGAIETGTANIGGEWYIKIGGYVVGGGNITAIGNTSSSNLIRVTGLPFSSSGGGSAPGAVAGSKISVMDRACMSTVSGSSLYFLQSSTGSGSWDYIKHSHVNQSSGSITFAFHYYCTS